MKNVSGLMVSLLLIACGQSAEPGRSAQMADLVLQNGKVVTVDDKLPRAEALAVIEGSR